MSRKNQGRIYNGFKATVPAQGEQAFPVRQHASDHSAHLEAVSLGGPSPLQPTCGGKWMISPTCLHSRVPTRRRAMLVQRQQLSAVPRGTGVAMTLGTGYASEFGPSPLSIRARTDPPPRMLFTGQAPIPVTAIRCMCSWVSSKPGIYAPSRLRQRCPSEEKPFLFLVLGVHGTAPITVHEDVVVTPRASHHDTLANTINRRVRFAL